MKQEKDSLLEISANGGEHLTTDMSTHHDDPTQSVRTLEGFPLGSAIDQRMLESQLSNQKRPSENGDKSNVSLAEHSSSDRKNREKDKVNALKGPRSDSKENNEDLAKAIDQNQLMAIQDVMVDMSMEER